MGLVDVSNSNEAACDAGIEKSQALSAGQEASITWPFISNNA